MSSILKGVLTEGDIIKGPWGDTPASTKPVSIGKSADIVTLKRKPSLNAAKMADTFLTSRYAPESPESMDEEELVEDVLRFLLDTMRDLTKDMTFEEIYELAKRISRESLIQLDLYESSIMKGIVDETELDENLRKWFKEKWVRFGPDGKIRGACARGDDSEGKPKCLPQSKAHNLGKKGRKYAASKKRREDPNPERTGKAKNVATKKKTDEGMTKEQLDELNCWSGYTRVQGVPAGAPGSCKKKTNEDIPFNQCPSCRGPIVHESMMTEKQDACYHKVKSRYKVWPSAYASGALVQCRKKGASNWGNSSKKSESSIMKGMVDEAGSPVKENRFGTPIEPGYYVVDKFSDRLVYQERFKTHFDAEGYLLRKIPSRNWNRYEVAYISDETGLVNAENWYGLVKAGIVDPNKITGFVNKQYNESSRIAYMEETAYDKDSSDDQLDEKWTKKYKDSINCSNPKGFSQKAHCAGKKKNESSIMKGIVDEAGSPSQQAAIAINMKKRGEKPKNEGTYTSPGDTKLPMDEAYRQARHITKQIKYDQTVSEIIVGIQMLAEKAGIPEKELQYAEDEVYEASRALESAVYGLDEVFKEALERQRYDDEELEEDSDMRYAAEKTPAINPYGGLKDRQFRGAISEISDTKTSTNQTGGFITPEYDDAYQRLKGVAPRLFQYIRNDSPVPLDPILTLKFLSQMRGDEEAVLQRIKQELSKDTKAMYGADHPNALAESVSRFWKKVINETPTDNPTGASGEGGWRKYKPKPSGEIEEDTAYAGGMGQGGNAGQSYRKFKPKPAGAIKRESFIMKGLRKEGR